MIIDPIVPPNLKRPTITDATPLASTTPSQATRFVDQQCFQAESGGSSGSRTSDDLSTPTQSSVSDQSRTSGEEQPSDPPPAYESIVASSAPNATRRVLKRSVHRSSCASSQQSGDSRDHIASESRETIHTPLSMRPVPEASDSLTYGKLPRPFVIQAKTSKHQLPDLFSSVGIPALPKHDVDESDWVNLLQELVVCSRYSTGQRVVARVLPVTKCLGPPGCLANLVIEQGMRKSKLTKSLALLDTWNETFFRPRKLEVILCKGDRCKSGRRTGFLAPDRTNIAPKRGENLASEPTDKDYRLVVISI
ncbi:unnamed protein product [Rhizoctonia solani]|uniref:Uncharacterized protein n=1 Tax=Rhizoctonia solani TaxID=456999 RepID=A0A8H3CKJ5_9AGAM|nr:unnamed protein product [Rhizoctonia solani]